MNNGDFEIRVKEVLHNLNWLLESHDSRVELLEIDGTRITLKCFGACAECDTNCIQVAFDERMPEADLVLKQA